MNAAPVHSTSSNSTGNPTLLVDERVLELLDKEWPSCPPSRNTFALWKPSFEKLAITGIYVWATLTCSFPLLIPDFPIFDPVCESLSLENSRYASIATVVLWAAWQLSVFLDHSSLKRAILTLDATLNSLMHPWVTFNNLLSKEGGLKNKVSSLRLEKELLETPEAEQIELDEMTTNHANALEEIEKKWAETRWSDEAARKVGVSSTCCICVCEILCVQHVLFGG